MDFEALAKKIEAKQAMSKAELKFYMQHLIEMNIDEIYDGDSHVDSLEGQPAGYQIGCVLEFLEENCI